MKGEIVSEVVQQMLPFLDNVGVKKLQEVLEHTLFYYEVTASAAEREDAVSIHKAQGLEYDSVKIVITNETEERITHNIFYTAITRAKNKLKIYWSPETEQSVLGRLEVRNLNKDAYLLAQLSSLSIL